MLSIATPKLRLRQALLVFALFAANVWPALYNGQPFFYADTTAYIRVADSGIRSLTHHASAWSQDASKTAVSQNSVAEKVVLSGRSVYYGALLYLSDLAGGFWPVVLLQSAVVLAALALTLESLAIFAWARLAAVTLLLDALTPMPFFISFLEPDIFAAVTILAAANLLVISDRKSPSRTVVWTVLLSAALLFHISDVLIATLLLILFLSAVLLRWLRRSRTGVVALACSLVIALAGELIFNTAVKRLLGAPPLRPPVLTARLIADGPGYRYLLASCPASGFEVCHFRDRLPVGADPFVWDNNPKTGIFAVAPPQTRRAISDEQVRFAWAVFRASPFATLTDFARDAAVQITRIGYSEFNYDSGGHEFFSAHLPRPYYDAMTRTRAWTGSIPASFLTVVADASTVLALIAIAYLLYVSGRSQIILGAFLCTGVIVNGAVCALSALQDRYETRVVWLIPFAAMLLYFKPAPTDAPQSTT